MAAATKVHAIHEAGHALIAHAVGLSIRSVRIDVIMHSGTDVDRGYDPVAADAEMRENASPERIRELLLHTKRDLVVTLGGIIAEQLYGVYTNGDPGNQLDETSAARLSDNVSLAEWKIQEPATRAEFSNREQPQAYKERARLLADQLVRTHSKAVGVLATRLESAVSISGDEAHRILEDNGAKGRSITAEMLS